MQRKDARLIAIAMLRLDGHKVSNGAGYISIARRLGFDVGPYAKNDARRAVVAYAQSLKGGVEVKKKAKQTKPKSFYQSREWKEVRYQALVRHGGKCQCCGASRADGATLHVDHIKPRSKFPELELSLDNLQVLCADCNVGKSNTDHTDWRLQQYSDNSIDGFLRSIQ